ncbi:MAG: L,D-transpeptidase [Actinomycetota bacterium]|nr:L,D-transpeptidase [Actinomycetota bacterium]
MNCSRAATGLVGVVLAVVLTACTSGSGKGASPAPATVTVTQTPTSGSAATKAPATTTAKPTPLGKPVHVSSIEGDGYVFGVGMPLIVRFATSPTSKVAFEKAATVTVNGKPAGGAWFWENVFRGSPIEAHYRPRAFWPANAKIHVALPVKGLSAGRGLSFANDLTLDYSIGAYHYARVDARALRMSVYNNGKLVRILKVSLGKAKTPTYDGTKIVMEKNRVERMVGPGYNELVPWSVRITNSGEFIHAAPWNVGIGAVSTSNGCTNLSTADATWFYRFSRPGDVVQYPNANPKHQTQPSWDGYGDWNLDWTTWQGGGVLGK